MNKFLVLSLILFAAVQINNTFSQTKALWTEAEREYLVTNLERTKHEIIIATQNLSAEQWAFKEDSTKWSIGQILEHLGLYERMFAQEADIMLSSKPEPELNSFSLPDSSYIGWMNDPSPHQAEWNAEPLGLMKGGDNLTFFLFGRNHLIDFIKNTTYDLKAHFTYRWGQEQRRSIHALMVVHFAHTDRHLNQVFRIKQAPSFPL
ncbi:DinB family protein [Algoriphagus antarcticus]|uniref:DinB family protein n=1 Tax=Algoriphagus antarcticus TaxID=238540 RepID=A0A3E0DCI0_9BACT|nr:DinB family protein [Algoriphagus antarcticus]REG79601.1 DinB family protein [Algoriphagus antarcticus]